MTKLFAAAVFLALALGGAFVFVGGEASEPVPAVRPVRADVESVLRTNGRVRAAKRTDVLAGASGVVRSVAVAAGDRVRRGAVLARLENAEARAQVLAAESHVEQMRARLERVQTPLAPSDRMDLEKRIAQADSALAALQSDRESVERLVEGGASPRQELAALDRRIEQTQSDLRALRRKLSAGPAQASVAEAQAALRQSERALAEARRVASSSTVRAPIDGEVYSVAVEAGQFAQAGSLVARLAGDGPAEVVVFVDEPELGRIRPGLEAQVTADAYPGDAWSCRIERGPAEVIELGSRRVGEVLCRVEGASDRLIPNLTVDVEIAGQRAADALAVPREAVVRTAEGDAVWIADQGAARLRLIDVGVRGTSRVEVRSGLESSDLVLLPAGRTLTEGQAVETARTEEAP